MNKPTAISLGYQVPDYGNDTDSPIASPGPSKDQKKKEVFPEFTIRDNLGLIKSLKAGQEFTATVRLRVSGIEIRTVDRAEDKPSYWGGDSGANADVQVLAITPLDITVEDDTEKGESAADALDEFIKGKKEKTSEGDE